MVAIRKGIEMEKRKIEILAPAGSYEGMKAAMNGGCDAVYIGGSRFGARAFAHNLEELDLKKAIDEAHIREKHIYLTVNTLLKDKEAKKELIPFLEPLYVHGIDAVIVQDVGVMHMIHAHFPDLDIHASTQATLNMAEGANLWKPYGVTRVVTPRELTLKEIKNIRQNTDLEIETFVHGALCYCYSGQCLMSSMIGGRSGNRGRCAQPCRMPYDVVTADSKGAKLEGKFLLSPKDINTVSLIPEFIDAGINSFKIEGRMKRPEYAALVSHIYRKYVDFYYEVGLEEYNEFIKHPEFKKDIVHLQDIYNRGGFSEGYGKQYHGKSMMSLTRPNHSGTLVGKVVKVEGSHVSIKLEEAINPQDILEIRGNGENQHEFTVKDAHNKNEEITTNIGRMPFGKKNGANQRQSAQGKISFGSGDMVYRTKNNQMLDQLNESYMKKDNKLAIEGEVIAHVASPLTLTLRRGNQEVTVYHNMVDVAQKQPMTGEKIKTSLEKTGDTLYYFDQIKLELGDNIFMPVAWLNEIRRDGISALEDAVKVSYRRRVGQLIDYDQQIMKSMDEGENLHGIADHKGRHPMKVIVSVQNMDQLEEAIQRIEVTSIYMNYESITTELDEIIMMSKMVEGSGKEFYLVLPHICRSTVYQRLKRDILLLWNENGIDGFVVKNFEEIALIKSLEITGGMKKKMVLDHNMYVMNQGAKAFYYDLGIHTFTPSLELNSKELKQLDISQGELMVYGELPLMVSAQCVFESTTGCTKKKNGRINQKAKLLDRIGKDFIVQAHCKGCYNIMYNGQKMSLLKYRDEIEELEPKGIRLDFLYETPKEVREVLDAFIKGFCYDGPITEREGLYTAGHFKRGIE